MITRPLAVLFGGLAVLGVATLHAATARRNAVPHSKSFAEQVALTSTKQLTTSAAVYEISQAVAIDDVSPDLISREVSALTHDLLNQSTSHGVALDWASFRSHIFDDQHSGVAKIIVRLDVL